MTRTSLNVIKFWYKKIYIALIIFLVSYFSAGCLPGINKNVKKQGSSEPLVGNYTMNDVTIDVIEIQNLNENAEQLLTNVELMDLITYSETAIGEENTEVINTTLLRHLDENRL